MSVATVFEVRGGSMLGILEPGDNVMVEPTQDIKRGDLVVFEEFPGQNSIKKCFGVAGDEVSIMSEDALIKVNGKSVDIKLSSDSQKFLWASWLKFTKKVPPGHLLLLGTSSDAIDSRSRGFFSLEQVYGKASKVQ